MNQREKKMLRHRFTKAAKIVVLPDTEIAPYRSGACRALSCANVPSWWGDQFRLTFQPAYTGAWWWQNPFQPGKIRAAGRTYDPQEARCLALLLMAEMIRTGDI